MTEPRIAPLPADEREPRTQELMEEMGIADRGMNLFDTLARHPRLLKRWGAFGGLLLMGGTLSARDREILILRTARNCGADYEWGHHVPIGEATGLTAAEMDALATDDPTGLPTEADRDLVRAADELHTDHVISDATWDRLAARLDEQQLIELCMVVGQYHLVAFTLRSLDIRREPGIEGIPHG